jgi:hypothetical protein
MHNLDSTEGQVVWLPISFKQPAPYRPTVFRDASGIIPGRLFASVGESTNQIAQALILNRFFS